MSGVSADDIRAVQAEVNRHLECIERHSEAYPDDTCGSLAIARLNTRLARNALVAAAAALEGYCAAYPSGRAQPPANPPPARLPFAHLRGELEAP